MVHAGCVFVAGIHPSRSWTSGSFESVRCNACVYRLTSVYTLIGKSFGGMESEPMLTLRENPIYWKNSPQRRIEPMTLHQAGQQAQHTTKELFRPHTEETVMKNVVDHLNSFWGRNSSLVVFGLAVHSVAGWILLCGNFLVEGIFLLELTWVQTPFPKNSFGWEYKPRSSLCTHAFHGTDSKDPDVHVLDRWNPATKTHPARTIHEDRMWLP